MKVGFVGLDIGGTYIRSIMTNSPKNVNRFFGSIKKTLFITSGDIMLEVENNICEVVDNYVKENEDTILKGIGISLAASVDRETGIITSWPNRKSWVGFNIRDYLSCRYQIPVKIEDDANCGALGEYYYGKRGICRNMLYITFGTGIGCGIIINGDIYIGDYGFAGELGHIIVNNKSICECGLVGCLQAQIEDYKDRKVQIVQAIYNLVMILDISNIIIGGGATINLHDFFKEVNEIVNSMLNYCNRKINIYPATNEEGSGVLGALHLLCNI